MSRHRDSVKGQQVAPEIDSQAMWLNVVYITHSIRSRSKTFKPVKVCCRLSDTVDYFISHMEYSWNLAFSNNNPQPGHAERIHKTVYQGYNEYNGLQNQIQQVDDVGEKMTLKAAGVDPKRKLYLQGYTKLKTCYNSIEVHILCESGKAIKHKIDVLNNTSIGDLKHKLQDKTGILVTDQELFSNKDPTTPLPDSAFAVSIQRRRDWHIILNLKTAEVESDSEEDPCAAKGNCSKYNKCYYH